MSINYSNNGSTPELHHRRVSQQYEYVTLDEVKDHLNIYHHEENDYLQNIILAASQLAESYVGDYFNETTIEIYAPTFCDIKLPHHGAFQIESIKYLDENNVEQTLSDDLYYLDLTSRQPMVRFEQGLGSPKLSTRSNPVTVTYITKLGDIKRSGHNICVDAWGGNDIKLAIYMYCSEIYFNRDNHTERKVAKLPLSSERLLEKYRVVVV